MSARFAYSTHVRCADPEGQQCPKLWRADGTTWNNRHGSAGWAARIPTSKGTKLVRRFGYGSKAAADAAARHAGQLLDLAGADAALRARVGDLIAGAKRGQPLPAVADARRRIGLGADPGSPGVTTGEWLETWLAGKRRTRRATAVRSYDMHIRVWLVLAIGHVPLERLNAGTDTERGVLTVERPVLQLGGKLAESSAKTRAGERLVFLDAETAGLLREHRKAQLAARMRAGSDWQDNDLVFCQADGRPWNPDHVSRRFQRLAAQAGVPVITLHEGGRHTGVSLMHDAEVREDIRMREAGHADRAVHARYNHALVEAHLAAAEQVAALVRQAGGES